MSDIILGVRTRKLVVPRHRPCIDVVKERYILHARLRIACDIIVKVSLSLSAGALYHTIPPKRTNARA